MGIGRRNFLRLTGLALAGVAINPSVSVITNNDLYINKQLGIMFMKPANWGFIKITDFGLLKNKQVLGNGFDDIKDEVWEELGDPICIATKYFEDLPENYGIFSPTITLNITPKKELEDLGFYTMEEVMEVSAFGTSQLLSDFKIVDKRRQFQLSGNTFYEYNAEYMFEHIEISYPLKVELKSLKTEHNGAYYDFNMHQSKMQNQLAEHEFAQFIKSIRLL